MGWMTGVNPAIFFSGRYYSPTKPLIHVLPYHCPWPHIHEPKRRAKHTEWSSFFNSYKLNAHKSLSVRIVDLILLAV